MARPIELSKEQRDELKSLVGHPGWQIVLDQIQRRREGHKDSLLGARSMEDVAEYRGRHDEAARLAEWVNTEAYRDERAQAAK